jgi:hypothetical protein
MSSPQSVLMVGSLNVGLNCDQANCWVYIEGKYALHGQAD